FVAVSLVGCGRLAAGPSGGKAQVGAQLYTQYGCQECHGINGANPKGPAAIQGHDLTNDLSEANFALLHYYLMIGPPKPMPAYPQVKPQEIADLNAQANSSLKPASPPPTPTPTVAPPTATPRAAPPTPIKKGPAPPPQTKPTSGPAPAAAADPQDGARLWVSTKCVQCHQINGVGGTIGKGLTNDPSMTYSAWKALANNPQQPPGMAYVPGLHLTDKQIRDMSAFAFSSLKPSP
ncbi:MAG: c-type cytochrome, partial [Chloroflexi bacterium]|nr:c-type cytochrome [Chloroflexota bacterium]